MSTPDSEPQRCRPYDELGSQRHLLVSERLRARRRELGLTQKEVVARLRRIGVNTTNKSLSSLEHGAGLDVCKLPEIARALECTLTYLVGLTADPGRWVPDDPAPPEPPAGRGRQAQVPTRRPPAGQLSPVPPILGPIDPPGAR